MNFAKKIERFFARIRQRRKMSVLLKEKKQIEVIEKFNGYPESTEPIGECLPIWVCWWQGEENMPAVVKTCYQSIQAHKGKHPVILVTFKNQQEYVKFPDFIWEKHHAGLISNTHLSDLLRMYLLKEHGGIWIDITNFITRDIDRIVTVDQTFWTCRHITTYNNVAQGLWTSFFLASGKGHLIPTYIYESLIHYWQTNDALIDYLLQDFIFKAGYDHLISFKASIDKIPLSPIGTMRKIMNKKYSPSEFQYHLQAVGFQKLSYKKYTKLRTSKGEETNFAHLLAKTNE